MKLKKLIIATSFMAIGASAFAQSATYTAPTTSFVGKYEITVPKFYAATDNSDVANARANASHKAYASQVFSAVSGTVAQLGTAIKIYNAQNNYDTAMPTAINDAVAGVTASVGVGNEAIREAGRILTGNDNRASVVGMTDSEIARTTHNAASFATPSKSLYTVGDKIEGATKSSINGRFTITQSRADRTILIDNALTLKPAVLPTLATVTAQ